MNQSQNEIVVSSPDSDHSEESALVHVLSSAPEPLQKAVMALISSHSGKISKLRLEVKAVQADIGNAQNLAASLSLQHMSPNRVRGLLARARKQAVYVHQCERAIVALENGFIPIPYLDYSPTEVWQVRQIPYRILKAIEEGGLKDIFDTLGVVQPQDETLQEYTFQETVNDRIRETKVLGRVLDSRNIYIGNKDPMLVGAIRVGTHVQWFLIGVWNDWLSTM